MGEVRGFLKYNREEASYRSLEERIRDYKEVFNRLPHEKLKVQAARCMDCGIPFCHSLGCPLCNLIPEWNDAIYKGLWREAYDRLELTSNFPEITGRVCPALCESSCTLSINSAPVTIREIELSIIEMAFDKGWVVPQPPEKETGIKIAVVGSGPAGLAAAQQLRRMGHSVTIYEKDSQPGGLLRYGIPDFKLDKSIIERRLEIYRKEGINFETNVTIGEDISVNYLRNKHDIVLLALGAQEPRVLPVPGIDLEGIHNAMDYLRDSNCFVSREKSRDEVISAKDKVVLVIGGGDTGSDCVGTANRQGAKKVYQFEIMPKPLEWDQDYNPGWPEWPAILRTSSSHKEGCERRWSIVTKQFFGRHIHVEEGLFARVEWTKDKTGKTVMNEVPDSEFILKVDRVFIAAGFVHVTHSKMLEDLNIQFDQRGNIQVDKNYMTQTAGVFAAGDAMSGASLVVRAMTHARLAAEGINRYLMNR